MSKPGFLVFLENLDSYIDSLNTGLFKISDTMEKIMPVNSSSDSDADNSVRIEELRREIKISEKEEQDKKNLIIDPTLDSLDRKFELIDSEKLKERIINKKKN